MRVVTFAEIGPRVINNGWPAMPINGKVAFLEDWPRYATEPIPDDLLDYWCRVYGRCNTGIPVPPHVVVIDCDVLDLFVSDAVRTLADRILGVSPLERIGRAPKWQRFYRGHGIGSRKVRPIEVFSGTGQVAAYGRHPETGLPFYWPDEEPINVTPDELPEVTASQVDQFIAEALAYINAKIPQATATHRAGAVANLDLHRRLREERARARGHEWSVTIARQLREAREGELHDRLINVVAALVGAGFSDARIREVVDAYFNAPRTGPYAEVWQQVDPAIAGARRRWNRPDPAHSECAA